MTGKELVEAAAKRAAEQCGRALGMSGTTGERSIAIIIAEDHFAPFAELIEVARERVDNCPNCMGITAACSRCVRMVAALAEVEKMGEQS
jgi:hypothetical protein